jgi:multidrug resistance efflux pump
MSNTQLKAEQVTAKRDAGDDVVSLPRPRDRTKVHVRAVPIFVTLATVALAALLTWAMWNAYVASPWTRDATVRVYVVTMAPEVAGQIVELPVVDNQFVHKGDLLMVVDPTNYEIAVRQAEASVEQATAVANNAQAQSERRQKQTTLSVSREEQQAFLSTSQSADAALQMAKANLAQARTNLKRTRIVSPVDGYVTNLLTQLGDYVNIGQRSISVIKANSFWVDGYFEETNLSDIHEGDPATIKLIGYKQIVRGHVDSISRGINVANAQPDPSGLASVNPIFTWVRLAQRVPVRIHIDKVPPGVRLAAGMTATVQIEPAAKQPAK